VGIPEPAEALWELVKETFWYPIWPPDDEDVAYALADAWETAATIVDEARLDIMAAVGPTLAAWPDTNGLTFADAAIQRAEVLAEAADIMRQLSGSVRQYGHQIVEAKINIWVEIGVNVALFAAIMANPLGGGLLAGLLARTIGTRLGGMISTLAGRNLLGPLPGVANRLKRLAWEMAGEVHDEAFIDATTQGLSIANGTREEFDHQQFRTASLAGGIGGLLGKGAGVPVGWLVSNPLNAGLRRAGSPEWLADQASTAVSAGLTNAVTSPIAGHAAHSVVEGKLDELDNVSAYVDKILTEGGSAGLIGAFRANTVLTATQLNPLQPSAIEAALADGQLEALNLPPSEAAPASGDPAPAGAPPDGGPPGGTPAAPPDQPATPADAAGPAGAAATGDELAGTAAPGGDGANAGAIGDDVTRSGADTTAATPGTDSATATPDTAGATPGTGDAAATPDSGGADVAPGSAAATAGTGPGEAGVAATGTGAAADMPGAQTPAGPTGPQDPSGATGQQPGADTAADPATGAAAAHAVPPPVHTAAPPAHTAVPPAASAAPATAVGHAPAHAAATTGPATTGPAATAAPPATAPSTTTQSAAPAGPGAAKPAGTPNDAGRPAGTATGAATPAGTAAGAQTDPVHEVATPNAVRAAGTAAGAGTPGVPGGASSAPTGPAATWNGPGNLPVVSGEQAVWAMRDTVRDTTSGYEFTGDERMHHFANRLPNDPGLVQIALHGMSDGTVQVGQVRMSADDFARGLRRLVEEGLIQLGDRQIRLISCYAGRGDRSLAAAVARELGREVAGGTDKVFSYEDGTVVVSSPHPDDERFPATAPDGVWRVFGPDGLEVREAPSDPEPSMGVPKVARPPTGSRAGPTYLHGGRLRGVNDPVNSYRSEDGRLHFDGDRAHTYRDEESHRLHHDQDPDQTYRTEYNFILRSTLTDQPVDDLLAGATAPPGATATVASVEQYRPQGSPAELGRAIDDVRASRDELERFTQETLRPLMAALDDAEGGEARYLAAELGVAVRRHRELDRAWREATARLRYLAARDLLAGAYGIGEDGILAGGHPTEARRDGDFAVAGFDPVTGRLVIVETSNPSGSGHTLQDGSRVERGTPQHVRDVLEASRRLHEALRRNPALLDDVHRLLVRDELLVEYRFVTVDAAGRVLTGALDLSGLDLTGVADRLPPPSGAPDPRLGARLDASARRVAGALAGDAGRRGLGRVTVVGPNTVEIAPVRGAPYRLEIRPGPVAVGEAFTARIWPDGSHTIDVRPETADRLDAATLDRLVARTFGHASGAIAAGRGGRVSHAFGRHGGRLAGEDALVNDAVPRRRLRPSRADLIRLHEIEALAGLHAASGHTQRSAIEAELRAFIEQRGLRRHAPGAAARLAVARTNLSSYAARLLERQGAWALDSNLVIALVRVLVGRPIPGARITPVRGRDGVVYRVDPEGWQRSGRATFTFEIHAEAIPDGATAHFAGTATSRHFKLVVDPDRLWAERQPEAVLAQVIGEQIREQSERPEEVSLRLRDRLIPNLPTGASVGAGLLVAQLISYAGSLVKTWAIAVIDVVTNNYLSRRAALDKAESAHDRTLSRRTDRTRIENGEVQRDVDRGFERARDLAEAVLGDPDLVSRAVEVKRRVADAGPLPDAEARRLLRRVLGLMDSIRRDADDPIDYLNDIHVAGNGYRLVIRGVRRPVKVEFLVRSGQDGDLIEPLYERGGRVTLRVPTAFATGTTDETIAKALRKALEDVVLRYYALVRDDPRLGAHLGKATAGDRASAGPQWTAGEAGSEGRGSVVSASNTAKSLAQALVARWQGQVVAELKDRRETFDKNASSRTPGRLRRNLAGQVEELSAAGRSLARVLLGRVTGTLPPPDPKPETGADQARTAVDRAIEQSNDRHGTSFELVEETTDDSNPVLKYRARFPGRREYQVEITVTIAWLGYKQPLKSTGERVTRGRFSFTANPEASPDGIEEDLARAVDTILYDRMHRISRRRWVREDLLPVGLRAIPAAVVGFVVGLPMAIYAFVTAAALPFVRFGERLYRLLTNDIELGRKLREARADNLTPKKLRATIGAQRAAVEELEALARRIEDRLAADPRTAELVQELSARLGPIAPPDSVLLPRVSSLLTAVTALPRDAVIAVVEDVAHTFRVTWGPANRPDMLTFEISTGRTDGATMAVHRINGDVDYAIRADRTASPADIARAVEAWLRHEVSERGADPTGLPSPSIRIAGVAKETAGQIIGGAVYLGVGGVDPGAPPATAAPGPQPAPPPVAGPDPVATQGAWTGNAAVGGATREVTSAARDGNEAVSKLTRDELIKRHFVNASEEQVAVAADDANDLLDGVYRVYDRLHLLEGIAGTLPPGHPPAPFQLVPVVWDAGTRSVASLGRITAAERARFRQLLTHEYFEPEQPDRLHTAGR
jgi:hypothetical protein